MPANNSKIMSQMVLEKIKKKYIVEYDESQNLILVKLSSCKRVTAHQPDLPFHINSKKEPKRKVCFNTVVIKMWIDLQKDDKTKDISIFDVQNAATELKVMYQRITQKNVLNLIRHKFEGIKKI